MATTIFNASFFAGLNLLQYTPHSFWITRYPPGREATVSWGGPELVVENDWSAAILLKVSAAQTGVTVKMYSADLGRRVATTTTPSAPTAGTAFSVVYTRTVAGRGQTARRALDLGTTRRRPRGISPQLGSSRSRRNRSSSAASSSPVGRGP